MLDTRVDNLAKNLIEHSVDLQPGENILIEATNEGAMPLAMQLIKHAYQKGANPFLEIQNTQLKKELINGCNEEQIKLMAKFDLERMKKMNAYISVFALVNKNDSITKTEKESIFDKLHSRPVHFVQRVENTKWCILKLPTPAQAQSAEMSTEEYEDFYYKVCGMDYNKMSKAMDGLVELMEKSDKVRIISKGTDISFSIKDIPTVKCYGRRNIPDGEVYTAPVANSVNGTITYNTPSTYRGFKFENVCFKFKDGKIIEATSNDTKKLNEILDIDKGARYIGEFAFGVNPYINKSMDNIIFDEKIGGSIHFTPGSCYKRADNGNESAIHWDLVQIQTSEHGGGEIYFDDTLIRKDGLFVLPELECLNPENLK